MLPCNSDAKHSEPSYVERHRQHVLPALGVAVCAEGGGAESEKGGRRGSEKSAGGERERGWGDRHHVVPATCHPHRQSRSPHRHRDRQQVVPALGGRRVQPGLPLCCAPPTPHRQHFLPALGVAVSMEDIEPLAPVSQPFQSFPLLWEGELVFRRSRATAGGWSGGEIAPACDGQGGIAGSRGDGNRVDTISVEVQVLVVLGGGVKYLGLCPSSPFRSLHSQDRSVAAAITDSAQAE